MTAARYQVFGTGVPALLGRSNEVAAIRRNWRNTHVSVIGPKFYGKTVLLRHMQGLAKEDGFSDVVYWDLRHPVPESEDQFYSLLQKHLRDQSPTVREFLPPGESPTLIHDAVYDAFETIQADDKAVLVIMQSMDEMLLRGDTINPNLWDQLAALAELSSIRFLISSRCKLIELVPSQRAKLSDFWRRIGYVCPLGAFSDADFDALFSPLSDRKIQFEKGARTEFLNWSGGIPPLAIGLCETLEKHKDGVTLNKADVDSAATEIDSRYLDEFWESLPADARDSFADLAENKERPVALFPRPVLEEFRTRGLTLTHNGRLKPMSRLLERYASAMLSSKPDLTRLFGNANEYLTNVRKLLELRVVQVAAFEPEIKSHFDAILQHLDHPDAAMKMLFGIFDRCADLLLKEDLADEPIPQDWIERWKNKRRISDGAAKDEDIVAGRAPRARGARMKLFSLLADDDLSSARASTICLLQNLLDASNYSRHAHDVGEKVTLSFACAALFGALELCGQLAEDLK